MSFVLCAGLILSSISGALAQSQTQPELGHRWSKLLHVDGLTFKDMDHTGMLKPYEDWRLPAAARADDLVGRMSDEQRVELLVHGTLPSISSLGTIGIGDKYDLEKVEILIKSKGVSSFITRLHADGKTMANQNNLIQEVAEKTPFGIPVTISTDPRHHFQDILGASEATAAFSQWPEALGLAAIGDAALTRQFGDVVRQEYRAVGIRESLAPQADLATEPRWPRIDGTFGEDPVLAGKMVEAYIEGIQNGANGLNTGSVAAVVKHWVGYGAITNGWDSHNYYGRIAKLTDAELALHIEAFRGAFNARVAGVMPTYAILDGPTVDGKPIEQVGAGFNSYLLTDLLRNKERFDGLIVSDWSITNDCGQSCKNGVPEGQTPTPGQVGMPWGVESLSKEDRFAKAINAGIDQTGGSNDPSPILEALKDGKISSERIKDAARRILLQKFDLGLFESPYVDEEKAGKLVGNKAFVSMGVTAQQHAVVLLQDDILGKTNRRVLPLQNKQLRIYLYGVDVPTAKALGLNVVDNADEADLAIIRATPPFESMHKNYFFGARQHEGRLYFEDSDPAYAELLHVSTDIPTIFVTKLERPILLANVKCHTVALLGDFGIGDKALLELLIGKEKPLGHLPFELPSSEDAVRNQNSALPHDSKAPLFPFHYGLSY